MSLQRNRSMSLPARTLLTSTVLLIASCADQPGVVNRVDKNPGEQAPDNTAQNARDSDGSTLTPLDQSTSAGDETITRDLRQSIVGDKSMSINAHNVKVITRDGVVTLRGPVATEDEKATIERKARAVSGVARVENQLDVARQ
jgi:hyperosmotically inducible periplasmic protein